MSFNSVKLYVFLLRQSFWKAHLQGVEIHDLLRTMLISSTLATSYKGESGCRSYNISNSVGILKQR